MKRFAVVAFAAVFCLSSAVSNPVERVIIVSVDGLGGSYIEHYIAAAPAEFPNFQRLHAEGAHTYNARCDYDNSETIPNHATMLTARPVVNPPGFPDTTPHGYSNNFPGAADTFHSNGNPFVSYKASFFDVAHDHGLSTALYVSKSRLAICERSYDSVNGAEDRIGEDNGRDKIDDYLINSGPSSLLVDALLTRMSNAPPHLALIHMIESDTYGHRYGWDSPEWSNAVKVLDVQLGRIIDAVEAMPAFSNRTALIVTADHGGGGATPNQHREAEYLLNYRIPFFFWGPSIPQNSDAYTFFANRGNPGTNRVTYAAAVQPLRDGDVGNLALALLRLPPIPGSFMRPAFSLRPPIAASRHRPHPVLSWPKWATGFVLEGAETLGPTTEWREITNGIFDAGSSWTRPVVSGAPQRFYRLRHP